MKHRIPIAIALFAAFVAGAWALLAPPDLPDLGTPLRAGLPEASADARHGPNAASPKRIVASVLAIDPRANPLKARATAKASLYNELLGTKQYKALYDRLKSSPEGQTAEGQYVLYEILRKCATITERDARRPLVRTNEQKRDDFIASLAPNDPQREKRIAAFDEVAINRCAGMENTTITQAELNKMLANAAAMGDAKAQALAIEQEMWAARRASGPQGRWGRDNVTLTDPQIDQLRQIVASRDPGALVTAGRILAGTWHDYGLRIGPEGQAVEQRAFMQAWQLLACDYGYPCGPDNERVLNSCAQQGHCDANSLSDYLFYYGASPHDSQLMAQYREILRNAIETGNWSQLTVVRGAPTPPRVVGRGP
jgi:hypothetical protein